jgi:hypothetical protein
MNRIHRTDDLPVRSVMQWPPDIDKLPWSTSVPDFTRTSRSVANGA